MTDRTTSPHARAAEVDSIKPQATNCTVHAQLLYVQHLQSCRCRCVPEPNCGLQERRDRRQLRLKHSARCRQRAWRVQQLVVRQARTAATGQLSRIYAQR